MDSAKNCESEKSPPNGTKKSRQLHDKVFKIRDSPLTERLNNNEDIRTVYNLFFVILLSLLSNILIQNYFKNGKIYAGYSLIRAGFNNFHLVIISWLAFYGITCLIFVLFNVWANIRLRSSPKFARKWDQMWLKTLIIYYVLQFYMVQKLLGTFQFNAGSASIILMEQIRLVMKQHSFIRSNAPKVLSYKPHTEEVESLPSFWKFVYFTFAPTCIYRDQYPRTKEINWKFVFTNIFEVLGIIFMLSLIMETFLIPPFEEFGRRTFSTSELLIPVLANTFPGIMFMLCGFYLLLHAVQNAFAEMLTFGDRLFYKDWWTARSLSEFYRTWNVVVHDWLYTYIYKDMYVYGVPGNIYLAKMSVFIISAVVHEWIIMNIFDVFLPIQFTQFFIAGFLLTLLNLIDFHFGNVVVWYFLVCGSGVQVNLYTLEWFARNNCPVNEYSFWDYFKPRFLTCNSIE